MTKKTLSLKNYMSGFKSSSGGLDIFFLQISVLVWMVATGSHLFLSDPFFFFFLSMFVLSSYSISFIHDFNLLLQATLLERIPFCINKEKGIQLYVLSCYLQQIMISISSFAYDQCEAEEASG